MRALRLVLAAALVAAAVPGAAVGTQVTTRYLVVLEGQETADGFQPAAGAAAVQALVASAGGTVSNDLSRQVGVVVAESPSAAFAAVLRASPLVAEVGSDWRWKGLPDASEVS